jgi:hypothetical protein
VKKTEQKKKDNDLAGFRVKKNEQRKKENDSVGFRHSSSSCHLS